MKESTHITDATLNAYLDGELDQDDRKQLVDALRDDEELNERLSRLCHVRSMLQLTYQGISDITHKEHPPKSLTQRRLAVAAVLTLSLGAGVGWIAHNVTHPEQGLLQLAQHVQLNRNQPDADSWRVLLHLTTDDPHRLKVVLDETEAILKQYAKSQQRLEMEVLANGQGLNLLRTDTSGHAQRIKALQQQYKNLVFMACGATIKRLQEEKKLHVRLLPDVEVTPSAIGELVRRQGEGWTYIKI